jgi:hypothetical protein
VASIASTNESYYVGQKVLALYSEDNCWYPAVINSIVGTQFVVTYDGYGNTEEVPSTSVRLLPGASPSVTEAVPSATSVPVVSESEKAREKTETITFEGGLTCIPFFIYKAFSKNIS